MTRYSVQPIDRIFVNGYGFLPFVKNISKNKYFSITTDNNRKIEK